MGSVERIVRHDEVLDLPPRSHRMPRLLTVRLCGRRFGEAGVVVRNISHGGAGCMSRQWLMRGEPVEIELPNLGWVPGTVAWTDGTRFGLYFDGEIDAGRVARETTPGMDPKFRVMDRYRPETSMRRPGLTSR